MSDPRTSFFPAGTPSKTVRTALKQAHGGTQKDIDGLLRGFVKKPKEEPRLIDKLLDNKQALSHSGISPLSLRMAKRFVLDAQASRLVADLIVHAGPLLMSQHQFARAPHPLTWLEMDFTAYSRGIPGMNPEDPTADTRVGYFIDNNKVYSASQARTRMTRAFGVDDVGVTPLIMHLHRPVSFEQELELAQELGTSRLMLRRTIIGDPGFDQNWWNTPEAADVCRSHSMEFYSKPPFDKMTASDKASVLRSAAGSLKQVLVMLLLLTRPTKHVFALTDEPHKRMLVKGKNQVLVSHTSVKLHLSPQESYRRVTEGGLTDRHHRFHSVRGHWCQSRKPANMRCTHEFEPITVDKYACLKCGGRRWWRKSHGRGDEKLGVVHKGYEVTK